MYEHGDRVEFELYPGEWETGTIYATFGNGDVVIQSNDSPPKLYERPSYQVKHV
jgi:hypothetical protein